MLKPCADPQGKFILILVRAIRLTSCFVYYRWTPLQTAAATGKAKGSLFDAVEDLDYAECLARCVALSKA